MRALPVTAEAIRERKWIYLAGGAVLAILGLAAIATPAFTSEAIERIVGWLLLIVGLFTGAATWLSKREGWGAWLSLGGALAAAVAGGLLLWSPAGGQGTLNSVLVGFFAASGFAKLAIGFFQRATVPQLWLWLIVAAVVDVAMAIAVLNRFPFQAGWLLGLLMGVSLLTSGVLIALIALRGNTGASDSKGPG
jgi:uncharacterized membrane protein HdeD (DUF308 family)